MMSGLRCIFFVLLGGAREASQRTNIGLSNGRSGSVIGLIGILRVYYGANIVRGRVFLLVIGNGSVHSEGIDAVDLDMFIISRLNDHSIASFLSRCSEISISLHHALRMKPWVLLRPIGRPACGIVALHRHKQERHKGRQESRGGGTPPCRDLCWASGEASLTAPDECTMSPVYENTLRTQSVYESIP
jgi:hypothetical protein